MSRKKLKDSIARSEITRMIRDQKASIKNHKIMKMERHLGDGLYVSFDGYQIAIAVNNHKNIVAYLDPNVMDMLVNYIKEIKEL